MLPYFNYNDAPNTQAIYSNPSNMAGIQGIELNGGNAASANGVDIDQLLQVLNRILVMKDFSGADIVIEQLSKQVNDKNMAVKLQGLLNAIKFNNDIVSRNEHTKKNMRTPQEVAKDLINELINYKKMKQISEPNVKSAQVIKHKKKKRGNPFRVLMGKIGKLLDHGLSDKQVSRYLSKQKYWSTETIDRAIKIVKKYNKKKHKQAVADLRRIIISEAQEIQMYQLNYEILSTAELLTRQLFLQACIDGTELGYKPENPRKELNVIQKILKERGEYK